LAAVAAAGAGIAAADAPAEIATTWADADAVA
jgi:hypothetical protein